jgi:hypothetical protein
VRSRARTITGHLECAAEGFLLLNILFDLFSALLPQVSRRTFVAAFLLRSRLLQRLLSRLLQRLRFVAFTFVATLLSRLLQRSRFCCVHVCCNI